MSSAPETAGPGTDRDRVARAQAGDVEAFTELVKRHQQRIHALGYRLTGSVAEAEDLAQETFVRAWRQLPGFRGDSAFGTWLGRIAINLGLNWQARERRRQSVTAGDEIADEAAPAPDPAHERVREALQRLPAGQRAVLVLTVYDGLNHAEAAQVLQCAETTVSWRIWMARRTLRRWLKDLAPSPVKEERS